MIFFSIRTISHMETVLVLANRSGVPVRASSPQIVRSPNCDDCFLAAL